jgi:hypothetical protein
MSDSRILIIRKSANIDPNHLSLPFMYINPSFGYSVDTIVRYVDESPDVDMKPDTFPYDIKEYYWIQEGEAGKKEWSTIGLLEDGLYFFYKAYTHNSFDKSGHMELWVSHKFSDIIQYAIDRLTYNKYVADTN